MTISVVLVDDHALVRAGLQQLLDTAPDIDVVGVADDGETAIPLIEELSPDVVLMDLSMPGMGGIDATRAIRGSRPETQVVVLTSFSDRPRILDALDAGAAGYLLKDAEPEELLRGVRAAAQGDSPIAPRAAKELLASRAATVPERQLTDRERDVLALLAAGHANKVIALRLGISEKTVKNHLTSIFSALGVFDRTQAALWARRHGLA